nr:ABC transporter permease [Chthoniobacterales bacterium]
LRQLVKAPGFTIAAVTVLALGIGANTAVFSLVHTMLFASPGYAQPAEVLQIYSQDKKDPKNFRGFSYPTYLDIRQQNTAFEDVMGYHLSMVGVGEKGTPRRAMAGIVSANYFSVLGVAPALGRAFLSEEETPRRGTRVAVVSDGFWKKRGRNAAILGSEVILNGRPFTIVGVMPKGFTGTMHMFGSEVWVPFGVREEVMDEFARDGGTTFGERAGKELMLVGRLKSGVTAEAAQPVLKGIAANLEGAYPVEQKDQTFLAAPLRRFGTSTSPSGEKAVSMLGGLLLGMSGIVLLVACLNLANMLLARGTARRKEIAIRLALGAARGRIIRQLLTEGFVLAVVGGAFGIVLALWSSDLLMGSLGRMLPIDIIYIGGPNLSLIAATLAFCFVGTLCFALGPALKLSRVTLVGDLKEQAGEDVVARRWKFMPRNPLVVVQFAFSLALVTAAALFVRGAGKAADVDTGLQTDRTFLVELDASLGGYDRARSQEVYRAVGEKLSSLPGVEASSISGTVPFGMLSLSKRVLRAGLQPAADAKPATAADGLAFRASWRSVGADYFKTTHLPLLRGRAFTAAEALSGGPAVAIIDEILAKKLWPDGDALGQRVQVYRESTEPTTVESPGDIEPGESIQIIGIAAHTREAFFGQEPESAIYVPFARAFQSNSYFFVKFASLPAGSEANAADLLRRTVSSVD